MRNLFPLLNPKSIAVIGGGWAQNVITQLQQSGYVGDIWPVHPTRPNICGIPCVADISDLSTAPDAAFIGVNRCLTVQVMQSLSNMGAGGAVCFASGFHEAGNSDLQKKLVSAAGDMPFLGPNCYGLLNYLDNATIWPDQHGGVSVMTGVGILAQSSNIAINLTMQKRGLPIGQMITVGNQAQTGLADLIEVQIEDPRITAIGLYLEGFGDIRTFERAALKARTLGKPIIALKVGTSEKSQISALSHTASLAGSAATSSAFLKRLGIAEVKSLDVFLETLKILHAHGPLRGNRLSSVSCSGGEASLMADQSENMDLCFPDFPAVTLDNLSDILGTNVTLANPLDYHTYIWGDVPAMTNCFKSVMNSDMDLNVFVLDIPRTDRCDPASFIPTIEAIIKAQNQTGAPAAILCSLPENLSEDIIKQIQAGGVMVLNGMETGLKAIEAAYRSGKYISAPMPEKPIWLIEGDQSADAVILSEFSAKNELNKCGLKTPKNVTSSSKDGIITAADNLSFPLALKALGLPHKTEAGGVILNINTYNELANACAKIALGPEGFFLEEMVPKPITELIIGITRDPTGLMTLTIGAGGILTELLQDSASLILPCSAEDIKTALRSLKVHTLLSGYRGQPSASIPAIIDAISSIIAYAEIEKDNLLELDVNPLMAGTDSAIAVDALIRLNQDRN